MSKSMFSLLVCLFCYCTTIYCQEDQEFIDLSSDSTYLTIEVELNPPPPPPPPPLMGVSKFISLERAMKNPLKVKELYLSKRGYTEFPKEIKSFVNIEILNLKGNDLKEIPSFIGELKKLKWLYLEYCQLENLPPELFTLDSLEVLIIRGNKLKNIPSSISQLKKLNYFDISENEITSLPTSLVELENLETFYCGYNQLTSFPENIGESKSLKVIWAGYNKMETIPSSIIYLSTLEELYVVSNQLSEIPEFNLMTNLQRLDIRFNKLTTKQLDDLFKKAPRFDFRN